MFIITKSGYTEITENVAETMMDISMRNRGKSPLDCEYTIEASPERYTVTDSGLVEKTDDELVAAGIITEEEYKNRKNEIAIQRRKDKYSTRSDPLFFEWQFDKSEEKKKAWAAEVAKIKSEEPKV